MTLILKKRTKQHPKEQQSIIDGSNPRLFEHIVNAWFASTCEAKDWSAKHQEDMRGELRDIVKAHQQTAMTHTTDPQTLGACYWH